MLNFIDTFSMGVTFTTRWIKQFEGVIEQSLKIL